MDESVLLIGEDTRVALAALRSLGRSGFRVILGTHDRESLALASRFSDERVELPDPMMGADAFARAVIAALGARRPALLLPAGDEVILPLLEMREDVERLCPLAVVDSEAYRTLRDRRRMLELARGTGLPVPMSMAVESLDEAKAAHASFRMPVALRPATGLTWMSGSGVERRPRHVTSAAELLRGVEEMLTGGAVLIEEEVPGQTVGIALLADRGQLVRAFQHRSLHELPPARGGGSTYLVSEALTPGLLDHGRRVAAALSATGMVELEFRADDRRTALIAMRGGFGPALPLAVAAGVDFPPLLVELHLGERGSDSRDLPGPGGYRVGLFLRSLRADLQWFGQALRGELPPGTPSPLAELARGKLRFLTGREMNDVTSWSDPGPGFAELGRLGRRLVALTLRRAHQALFRLAHLAPGPLAAPRCTTRRILVICDGNICRSPFAEILLAARLSDLGVVVESTGLRAALGHPAPPLARAAARDLGISIDDHRSRPIDGAMIAAADLILVMDLDQRRRLLAIDPAAAERVELLGRYDPSRFASPEIADPVFGDAAIFRRVYLRLAVAVERLAAGLRSRASG
jgi:protein-tyrosine-phosphatase/predicted ATP-grasp superfamily ATP-dependent carboligase